MEHKVGKGWLGPGVNKPMGTEALVKKTVFTGLRCKSNVDKWGKN
jgi:hypothetical protein